MSALSPTTRVVLDAMCDGNAQTLAVMRHACIEARDALISLQSRLAAAEARVGELEGVLTRCRPYVCKIPVGRVDPESGYDGDQIASAIDALLAPKSQGPAGGEVVP